VECRDCFSSDIKNREKDATDVCAACHEAMRTRESICAVLWTGYSSVSPCEGLSAVQITDAIVCSRTAVRSTIAALLRGNFAVIVEKMVQLLNFDDGVAFVQLMSAIAEIAE
jgi:hypothetical protein